MTYVEKHFMIIDGVYKIIAGCMGMNFGELLMKLDQTFNALTINEYDVEAILESIGFNFGIKLTTYQLGDVDQLTPITFAQLVELELEPS